MSMLCSEVPMRRIIANSASSSRTTRPRWCLHLRPFPSRVIAERIFELPSQAAHVRLPARPAWSAHNTTPWYLARTDGTCVTEPTSLWSFPNCSAAACAHQNLRELVDGSDDACANPIPHLANRACRSTRARGPPQELHFMPVVFLEKRVRSFVMSVLSAFPPRPEQPPLYLCSGTWSARSASARIGPATLKTSSCAGSYTSLDVSRARPMTSCNRWAALEGPVATNGLATEALMGSRTTAWYVLRLEMAPS